MKVTIYGSKREWMPEDWKRQIHHLIDHTCSGWLTDKRMSFLEVKVCLNKKHDLGGEVFPDWMARQYKPNHFKITINPDLCDNMKEFMIMIAHESIHITQYATGRLAYRKAGTYWEGKKWNFPAPRHLGGSAYWETPWEVESYGLEKAMIWSFVNVQELAKEMTEKGWLEALTNADMDTSEIEFILEKS